MDPNTFDAATHATTKYLLERVAALNERPTANKAPVTYYPAMNQEVFKVVVDVADIREQFSEEVFNLDFANEHTSILFRELLLNATGLPYTIPRANMTAYFPSEIASERIIELVDRTWTSLTRHIARTERAASMQVPNLAQAQNLPTVVQGDLITIHYYQENPAQPLFEEVLDNDGVAEDEDDLSLTAAERVLSRMFDRQCAQEDLTDYMFSMPIVASRHLGQAPADKLLTDLNKIGKDFQREHPGILSDAEVSQVLRETLASRVPSAVKGFVGQYQQLGSGDTAPKLDNLYPDVTGLLDTTRKF